MSSSQVIAVLSTSFFWLLLAAATLARLISHGLVVRRLRIAHPAVRHGMGAPPWYDAFSIRTYGAVERQMRKGAVASLSDRVLGRLRAVWVWSGRIGLVSFAVVVVSLFFH